MSFRLALATLTIALSTLTAFAEDAAPAPAAAPALAPVLTPPPEGALKLIAEGGDLSHWESVKKGGDVRWTFKDGVLTVVPGSGNIITKEKFQDFQLHVEFKTHANLHLNPAGKEETQSNGNSGVYIQRRYEVQVLNSAGRNPPLFDDCGAIYRIKAPSVNAALPAGQWQSYDITFHAARFDDAGKKTKSARITVIHNGVKIHDDFEIPSKTGAGQPEAPTPDGILLQDHNNPADFRNMWIVALK